MPWRLKTYRGCGFLSWFLTTQKEMRQPRSVEYPHVLVSKMQLQGTEDTELTLTREGDYIGSPGSNVEEINIFEGRYNRITFEQVYSKVFKCTYQLQLYPFDTQVPTILKRRDVTLQVCTVNLIVRKLETSVMEITPHIITMESETVLTQYIITNWTLEYKDTSNVNAGIKMTLVLKRRILNAILTVYLPTILVLIIVYATNFFKDFFFEVTSELREI